MGKEAAGSFFEILARTSTGGGKRKPAAVSLEMNDGQGLLEQLRRILLTQGGRLDQLQVNENGLLALRKILVAAGYKPDQVTDLFNGLKSDAARRTVSVSDLFAKLNQMDEKALDKTDLLDLSVVPYLQVILSKMGIDQTHIDRVVSDSAIAGEGIDLKRLIQGLRGLVKQGQGSGASRVAGNNEQIANLMAGMDLPAGEAGSNADINLETFIATLDKKFQTDKGKKPADRTLAEAGERFLKNVFTKNTDKDDSPLHPSSKEKIGSVFPNKMMDNERAALSQAKSAEVKSAHLNKIEPGKAVSGPIPNPGMEARQLSAEKWLGGDDVADDMLALVEGKINKIQELVNADARDDLSGRQEDQSNRTMASMGEGLKASSKTGSAFVAPGNSAAGKTLPAYVLHQVGRQIVRSVQENSNEIQLQLKPPHLGRLHLSLETVKDGVRVSIVTEQKATRELLASHVEELRAALLDQGVRLEKIDVQIAFNFDQHMAQTREDANRSSGRRNSAFQMPEGNDQNGGAVEELAVIRPRQPSSLLDLIV